MWIVNWIGVEIIQSFHHCSVERKSGTIHRVRYGEAALIILAALAASLALIIRELRKAPEGYEDERGFHVLSMRVRASLV